MKASNLALFAGQKYLNLEAYRKNGEAVQTPVWFVEDSGLLHVWTDGDSGKAKRVRKNPRVRVVPCSMRGTPRGEWIEGEAKLAPTEEVGRITKILRQKYGIQFGLVSLLGRRGRSEAGPVVISIRVSTG